MSCREYPVSPMQRAVNGALDIFVEGCQRRDRAQMCVGLSVLQGATAQQVRAAMASVQPCRNVSDAGIEAMLAS